MSIDGIYDIVFGTWQAMSTARIVVRDGRFKGETERGTKIDGTVWVDRERARKLFQMHVHVPPDVETVTGIVAGPAGRTLTVTGDLPREGDERRFSFGLAGRAVDVLIRYVGPDLREVWDRFMKRPSVNRLPRAGESETAIEIMHGALSGWFGRAAAGLADTWVVVPDHDADC